jgi:hypothetical protein
MRSGYAMLGLATNGRRPANENAETRLPHRHRRLAQDPIECEQCQQRQELLGSVIGQFEDE